MLAQDFSFSRTLNPNFRPFSSSFRKSLSTFVTRKTVTFEYPLYGSCNLAVSGWNFPFAVKSSAFSGQQNGECRRDVRALAGRSKKKPGGYSGGRIEGNAEVRRQAKRNARIKSRKLAESLFYRLKNPNRGRVGLSNHPDKFTEEELEMIGLGYDRMVQFMDKDDPNLRHPYDWYKYGEFGPYSWRGVVVGEPIRGTISDECVSMIGEVKDHEEWEKIEQHEMATDFQKRVKELNKSVGLRYFWVFVRHPKWRLNELPWQQWTLVCEVVVEAEKKERLDKWNLMGRLGNKTRSSIAQCAAWFRPDIVYVKKPVFQCRFEPQDDFFNAIVPYLDPKTESGFLFDLEDDEGKVETCTYFSGLCKIVKVNQKAFVDDVVNAYEKLSAEKKSKCLKFLLSNHPVNLLHPYTKEWKAKLEEMELGCDAPDEDEEEGAGNAGEAEFTDWIEDEHDENEVEDDEVLDMEGNEDDDGSGGEEEEMDVEEDENYWEEEFKKAVSSADRMEKLAERSMEISSRFYEKQLEAMEARTKGGIADDGDGDELAMRGKKAKVNPQEWKIVGYGRWRKRIKKSKIPPELFLRAAVRPFTYRNLVKEIVLTRHAILEGEIGPKD